jgi:hypothetical protein
VIAPTPRATIAHLVFAAALLAVCATAAERDRAASAPTVLPGQRAVVHTVFRGAAIDSFEAVIVGTLASGRTQGDMILARATSESVIQSGIAQGMSGSPVYVGGRLIGALSSGWAFNREPLFGITPLGEMLELWNRPASDTTDTDSSGPSGADEGGTARLPRWDMLRWSGDDAADDAATLAQVAAPTAPAPTATGLTRLALPLACGGLDPRLMELARRWFEPVGLTAVPGGVAKAKSSGAKPASRAPSHAGPAALEPGSAVAVEVLRGDLQFAAIGTVTWRDGDRVLLFGHPFFQSGNVRMPMATADIVTVVSSNQMSFKLGQRVDEVGAVTEDRRAGVAGLLGAKVEMLPLTGRRARHDAAAATVPFRVDRGSQSSRRRCSRSRLRTALLESGGTGSSQTVRWRIRLRRSGLPPLELRDVTVSESPATDVAAALASPLRFLYGNPFAPLDLDSVSIALDVEPGRESWTLRSARLLDPTVRPGGTARDRVRHRALARRNGDARAVGHRAARGARGTLRGVDGRQRRARPLRGGAPPGPLPRDVARRRLAPARQAPHVRCAVRVALRSRARAEPRGPRLSRATGLGVAAARHRGLAERQLGRRHDGQVAPERSRDPRRGAPAARWRAARRDRAPAVGRDAHARRRPVNGGPVTPAGIPARTRVLPAAVIRAAATLLLVTTAQAADTQWWIADSPDDYAKAESHGVIVHQDGSLELGPRVLTAPDDSMTTVWALGVLKDGSVALGGDKGRIDRWTERGGVKPWVKLPVGQVLSLGTDGDGLVAGTGPEGLIYRIGASGDTSLFARTGERYVWGLAPAGSGAWYAATGTKGRLLRVTRGKSSIAFDSDESNLVSIVSDGAGGVFAGGDSHGKVVHLTAQGRTTTVFDAGEDEIRALALVDGALYAAGLSAPAVSGGGNDEDETPSPARAAASGARAVVYRIVPDSVATTRWTSPQPYVYALLATPQGVLAATGNRGGVYRLEGGEGASQWLAAPQGQITALVARGGEVYAASANPAALLRLGPGKAERGELLSPALDAPPHRAVRPRALARRRPCRARGTQRQHRSARHDVEPVEEGRERRRWHAHRRAARSLPAVEADADGQRYANQQRRGVVARAESAAARRGAEGVGAGAGRARGRSVAAQRADHAGVAGRAARRVLAAAEIERALAARGARVRAGAAHGDLAWRRSERRSRCATSWTSRPIRAVSGSRSRTTSRTTPTRSTRMRCPTGAIACAFARATRTATRPARIGRARRSVRPSPSTTRRPASPRSRRTPARAAFASRPRRRTPRARCRVSRSRSTARTGGP